MTTDEIINKLGVEPCESYADGSSIYTLTNSDLDRIVAELSAGYEAQIKVLRDALAVAEPMNEGKARWLIS